MVCECKEYVSVVVVCCFEGFGVVWMSDLVDYEKFEVSWKFFLC